jgi:multidrug efflux pump subunit AcrB
MSLGDGDADGDCGSNSTLIVEFAHHLLQNGSGDKQAAVIAYRVRLVLGADELAAIIGLLLRRRSLARGANPTAPLSGGLTASALCRVFVAPAGFDLAHRKRNPQAGSSGSASRRRPTLGM